MEICSTRLRKKAEQGRGFSPAEKRAPMISIISIWASYGRAEALPFLGLFPQPARSCRGDLALLERSSGIGRGADGSGLEA